MTTTIFVTGGSGFIGRALCAELRRCTPDATILGLARSDASAEVLAELGARPVRGTLADPQSFRQELLASRWVFHLGANAAFSKGADYCGTNVEATRKIVAILKDSTRLERLVFTSSIGAIDRARSDPCSQPLTVASPAHPCSEYGRSKLAGEEIIRNSSLPFTIIRPSWVYGRGMRRESHIAVLLDTAARGKLAGRLRFPGKVSVIHVTDLARALARTPLSEETAGRTYFADDGVPRSFGEIFEMGHRLAGHDAGPFRLPSALVFCMRKARRFLPFALGCLFGDVLTCSGTLFADLGLEIAVPWEDGIRETWEYLTEPWDGVHLVTGAASGIGLALAQAMAKQGKKLLLVDKSESVKEAAKELGQESLVVDLATGDAVQRITAHLRDRGWSVEGLVNCAGFGFRGGMDVHSPEVIDELARVNFLAPAQLCRMVLPTMKKRRAGYILNIVSSIAEVPLPGMAMYGATKAALFSLTRSLRGELAGSGVKVVAVLPSGTRTAFQQSAGVRVLNEGRGLSSAQQVARIALKALASDRPVTLIGLKSKVLLGLTRLLPQGASIRLWAKMMSSLR